MKTCKVAIPVNGAGNPAYVELIRYTTTGEFSLWIWMNSTVRRLPILEYEARELSNQWDMPIQLCHEGEKPLVLKGDMPKPIKKARKK